MSVFANSAIVAYFIYGIGLLMQIKKIIGRKQSEDISLFEVFLRFGGGIFLLISLIGTNNYYLIGGQASFSLILSVYLFLVFKYRYNKNYTPWCLDTEHDSPF